jgi:hypothetical protein
VGGPDAEVWRHDAAGATRVRARRATSWCGATLALASLKRFPETV